MRTAIYPGSFDPFTVGHMDILQRACLIFDHVHIAILCNRDKTPFFTLEERMMLIERAVEQMQLQEHVSLGSFDGLLVGYAQSVGATHIVRGLRELTDFQYEYQMNVLNRRMAPTIDTMYFMAEPEHAFLSSSIVKEVGSLGGSIDGLVADCNKKMIAERLVER